MATQMESDTQLKKLVEKARSGDRGAFAELFEGFRSRLRNWIEIRLGAGLRKTIEVDDIVQEVSLQALRSIPRFEWKGEEALLYWLSRIAENVIRNAADRRRRRGNPQSGPGRVPPIERILASGAAPPVAWTYSRARPTHTVRPVCLTYRDLYCHRPRDAQAAYPPASQPVCARFYARLIAPGF